MTAATVSPARAQRAVWGLVDDRYDVAARTPSLSPDDARRLCRVPDMGDPGAPLDDAVAYLVAPEWGPVCARYYTNAQRDSSGRLTIVYDVVRPTAEMLIEAAFNPFRVFAPASTSRTIEIRGELAAPSALKDAGAARLAELLSSTDERMLIDVLAAVLASGHVLWLTSSPLAVIETIVLVLPDALRERFTFQSRTLNRPAHLPVLTVAEQQMGSLRDALWSVVLPRDRANLAAAALDASASLVELARDGERLARAHCNAAKFVEHDSAASMLATVERMLRLDRFLADCDRSDVAAALVAVADAPTEAERTALGAEVVSAFDSSQLAAAAAELLERTPAAGWSAIDALVPILEDSADPAASTTLSEIVARTAASWLPDDASSLRGRTMLATFAAKTRQADATVLLLPRDPVHADATERKRVRATPSANEGTSLLRFVELALTPRPTISAARDMLALAIPITRELSSRRAAQRLSVLQFAAVRRAVAASAMSCHASELESLRKDLLVFWKGCAPAGELDTAAKRLFGAPNDQTGTDARAVALSLARDADRAGAAEIIGWVRFLLQPNGGGVAAAAAFAAAWPANGELASHIGALVRAVVPHERAAPLTKPWMALLDLADAKTRRDLLIEAVSDAIARASSGESIGAVCDACVALGERGLRLDVETSRPVIAALARMRAKEVPADAALRLRIACATVEHVGDDDVADAIAASVWGETTEVNVVGGRLFLAAAALRAVERIRPAAPFAALADAASADLSWRSALPAEHARRITRFLRLGGPSSLAALIRRELPDETLSAPLSPR
jgi:hypothetical protein